MKDYINIEVSRLHDFAGHPYKVLDNEEMDALVESVREHGVMSPLIVRPLEGTTNEYEVISGHRRLHAAEKAGMKTVPAFIHAVDRDTATIELVDSNLHREHILPSEKAFAYKLKMEAMKHHGRGKAEPARAALAADGSTASAFSGRVHAEEDANRDHGRSGGELPPSEEKAP